VLRALHRFGWLRTRDLAALVWQRWATKAPITEPGLKPPMPTAAGLRMAQRTLRRLRESRQVLSAQAPDGSVIYALSEAGARTLQGIGVSASTGKDQIRSFSSSQYRHRCIANEIAIGGIIQGYRASPEREIARGLWLGGLQGIAGKKPDVLLRSGSVVWWIEVERSRKNAKDYAHLLDWLDIVRRSVIELSGSPLLVENLSLSKIVFICTAAFRAKLVHDLEAKGWKKTHLDTLINFSTSLYSFENITFS
jgi:hypothetical protein